MTIKITGNVVLANGIGSSALNLSDLHDVTITTPSINQYLTYDDVSAMWINSTLNDSVFSLITSTEGVTVDLISGLTSIGLGDITPLSVAATGTVTGSNLSGTNTGDQTITLTGDATNADTSTGGVLTLANTGVVAGTFGSVTEIPVVTVDSKGRVTEISVIEIADAGGTVTSISAVGNDGIVITGSPITSSGTLTFDLGAITPTSVAATGTVTGSNLSGTNTGNQTITLTGDVTGTGTGSFAATLATTNSAPQTNTFRKITVNGKGLVTATSAVVAADITPIINATYVLKAGDTMTGALVLPYGTAAAPGLGVGDADTGLFGLASNVLGFTTSGGERARFDVGGNFLVGSSVTFNNALSASAVTPRMQLGGMANSSSSFGMNNFSNNTSVAGLYLGKSRGGVLGAQGIVADGDATGAIMFNGSDGVNMRESARIQGNINGTPGVDNMPGSLLFLTTAPGATVGTTRLAIGASGHMAIGGSVAPSYTLRINKPLTGATTGFVINNASVIQSDVTTGAIGFYSNMTTAPAAFNVTSLQHFYAAGGTPGAGSSITNQYGFYAHSSITGATNNYAFHGAIAAATGCWNLYMSGTAENYLRGNLGIGTNAPAAKLDIGGNTTDTVQAIFARGVADPTFQLWAASGDDGIAPDTIQASFGLVYAGNGENAMLRFLRGTGELNGSLAIATNNSERMRIDSNGYVYVGLTSGALGYVNIGRATEAENWLGFMDRAGNPYGAIGIPAAGGVVNFQGIGTVPLAFSTNAAERMRVDSNGNVGIGTSSPDYSLEVEGTTPNISVHKTAVDTTYYGYRVMAGPDTLSAWLLNATTGHVSHIAGYLGWGGHFTFTTNGAERMRINENGTVLIGTNTPFWGGSFEIATANARPIALHNLGAGAGSLWSMGPDTSNAFCVFNQANTGCYIPDNGTAWAGLSDETLKTDLVPILNATERVSALRAVTGRFKTDVVGKSRSFLIAQDVQAVLPEAVSEVKVEEGVMKLGLAYTDIIPLLVAAIKEQTATIADLTARLTQLEGLLP